MLTPSEIKFLYTNYDNNTSKTLVMSLNKIRRGSGQPLLRLKEVRDWMSTNFPKAKVDPTPRIRREYPLMAGGTPIAKRDDLKTQALRSTMNESATDALLSGLDLFPEEDEHQEEQEILTERESEVCEVLLVGQITNDKGEIENLF